MSARTLRVCPACHRPARNRPLPPEGFWQEQVLQRIGMYPYRCEVCGARFFRRVPVGDGLGDGRLTSPTRGPAPSRDPASSPDVEHRGGEGLARSQDQIPKVVRPPEDNRDFLSHEEFVDLVDHISLSEHRKGIAVPEKDDEEQ